MAKTGKPMGTIAKPKALVCSCEGTIPLDLPALSKACPSLDIQGARQLCRAETERFIASAGDGRVVVACTQERAAFEEVADERGLGAALTFTNIRERAGWSSEGEKAGPKIAALLAAACEEAPPVPHVSFQSEGVTLILGRDEAALSVAGALSDVLDITLLLTGEKDVPPPRTTLYPIRRGTVKSARGFLGQFELTVDGYAEPAPSSRERLVFSGARNGLKSRADIVIDLSGRPPLFSAPELRDGYLRADPGNAIEVERLIRTAARLTGTFDKPRYVAFKPDLCAHSRSRITGCTRCLDLCPAGAIAPHGDHVAIDPYICGGCGQCAATCPTGAAGYAILPPDRLTNRLRTLLSSYRKAGGVSAVVLFHDGRHGADLIDAAARFSRGLPANVLPVEVNEVTQVGLEAVASAVAYGAAHVVFLLRKSPRHDPEGLHRTLALAQAILVPLGWGDDCVRLIETDDPDTMLDELSNMRDGKALDKPATFAAAGGRRAVLNLALRELNRVSPTPQDAIALPDHGPMGRVSIDAGGCTLCLSCVSACPTSALTAGDDKPLLKFDESLCVQCGLCRATCPEKVVTLEARVGFKAFEDGPVVLKEEEPFCCISCGTPFGVKSTIDKIVSRLEGKHWMFTAGNARRLDLVKMCDTCRITAVTNDGLDPYAAAPRPQVRTSDDYFAERERQRALRKTDDEPQS